MCFAVTGQGTNCFSLPVKKTKNKTKQNKKKQVIKTNNIMFQQYGQKVTVKFAKLNVIYISLYLCKRKYRT